MLIVVVTGGLGAGKTTATDYFRSRGAAVICLDDIARHVLDVDTPVYSRVVEEFGEGILAPDGSVDPEALADAAFSSAEQTEKLNALMHPEIARQVGTSLMELRLMPQYQAEVVVLEVPLLVEAPVFGEIADEVLAIMSPVEMRIQRAVARGMSREDASRRIAQQASDEERSALATAVVTNDADLAHLERQLSEFWDSRVRPGGIVER